MESIAKELERVVSKAPGVIKSSAATSSKRASSSTNTSVPDSIDQLIDTLEQIKRSLRSSAPSSSNPSPAVVLSEITAAVSTTQRKVGDRQKDYYGALNKLSKAIDKKFPTSVSGISDPQLFSSPEARRALEGVVLEHLIRDGQWDTARVFAEEAKINADPSAMTFFEVLHSTQKAILAGDLSHAIEWARSERSFLAGRGSLLEFALHRSQFVRIALGLDVGSGISGMGDAHDADAVMPIVDPDGDQPAVTAPTNTERALAYGRQEFKPFLQSHMPEIQRLYTLLLFLPSQQQHRRGRYSMTDALSSSLAEGMGMWNDEMSYWYDEGEFNATETLDLDVIPESSSSSAEGATQSPLERLAYTVPGPYRYLLSPAHTHAPFLAPLFRLDYCASAAVAKEPPLKIAVEVGAGGALNRILKVRSLMKERGTEWSQADELPVEIPLPPHLRFHSTFACPVSKEQGTELNPPMLMFCGHVVCQESLAKLGQSPGHVKCQYCSIESTVSQAIRVYF